MSHFKDNIDTYFLFHTYLMDIYYFYRIYLVSVSYVTDFRTKYKYERDINLKFISVYTTELHAKYKEITLPLMFVNLIFCILQYMYPTQVTSFFVFVFYISRTINYYFLFFFMYYGFQINKKLHSLENIFYFYPIFLDVSCISLTTYMRFFFLFLLGPTLYFIIWITSKYILSNG